jgi:CheY-like chemotaxis protein
MLHDDTDILPMTPGPLVLVVDDEAAPRAAVTRMLHEIGCQVRSCSTGRAALRFLAAYPREARVLLADLGMPGMDGGELAERARDLDPGLRVLLLLEPDDPRVVDLASGYHDLPSLRKPVTFGDLYRKVQDLVGPPAGPPTERRGRPRPRRRSSGHHTV